VEAEAVHAGGINSQLDFETESQVA
jgi:hypothetical protein